MIFYLVGEGIEDPNIALMGHHWPTSETPLNKYFASVAEQFQDNNANGSNTDYDKIRHFVNSKVPSNTSFNIPFITTEQVSTYIKRLDSSKAMGLDGPGPRLLRLAVNCLSSSIAALINKSLATGQFPSQ